VTVSASGKAALEEITAQGYVPDIVVADFRLPGELDGVEVVNRIQLVVGGAIPAIIITGEAMTEEIREISDLGHRVLAKPVRPAKLRALFRHLLSGKI
jgi:CheY-like chemotaxis protein